MAKSLDAVSKLPQDQKLKGYQAYFEGLIASKKPEAIKDLVEHCINKEGATQHGRTYITPELLNFMWKRLGDVPEGGEPPVQLEELEPLMEAASEIIRDKGQDFPDQLMGALKLRAAAHQGMGNWKKAAQALSSFKFDQYRTCKATPRDQLEWNVDCAENYLEIEDSGAAYQTIQRAHALVKHVRDDIPLLVRFKTAHARVLDSYQKFFEASIAYLELSQMATGIASEEDLLQTLENAVVCAILSKAGPKRSRVLAMLYSDERSRRVPNSCAFTLLEKMFKERIIRDSEVKQFESILKEHQTALTGTGMTVLQNSIVEHNTLACSRIYNNIRIDQLAQLVGVSQDQAEGFSSKMIEQGRMAATIDQVNGLVEFEGGAGKGSLYTWDEQIEGVCNSVNNVLETIHKKFPQYEA